MDVHGNARPSTLGPGMRMSNYGLSVARRVPLGAGHLLRRAVSVERRLAGMWYVVQTENDLDRAAVSGQWHCRTVYTRARNPESVYMRERERAGPWSSLVRNGCIYYLAGCKRSWLNETGKQINSGNGRAAWAATREVSAAGLR